MIPKATTTGTSGTWIEKAALEIKEKMQKKNLIWARNRIEKLMTYQAESILAKLSDVAIWFFIYYTNLNRPL